MIRGVVKSVVQGVIQRVSAVVWGDGSIDDRELFQHYGYTSRPKEGAEVIFIRQGNAIIAIASDDRRYRLALEDGETALYDWQGQKVHLKAGKEIEISGCDALVATAAVSATVTAPEVTVVASTKVRLQTPLVQCSQDVEIGGNLAVAGDIAGAGEVADAAGPMSEMRTIYNGHTQPVSAGVAQAPNQEMT